MYLDQGWPFLWLPWEAYLCCMDSGSLLTEPLTGCIKDCSFTHSVLVTGYEEHSLYIPKEHLP